jgi:hypothetical protein
MVRTPQTLRHTLTSLPEDIYHCIKEFTSINALLNTSKRGLSDVKRRLFYWNLNKEYSQLYYSSGEFRERLLGLVHDSKKQVSLNLSYCDNVSDVSALGHVHTLNLRECPNVSDVSALSDVHTLSLSWCSNVLDFRVLSHVHTLHLSYCEISMHWAMCTTQ